MKNSALRTAGAVVAALVLSFPAGAQLFRAYVSSAGNDSNPCTLPSPCRLLPAALAAVADGGEIWMLDSANYNTGPVNIAKSVSILAIPRAVGSVVALGGNAIAIATPGVRVALRNLVLVPFDATGANGIYMTAGASLVMENCLVANMPAHGVFVSGVANVRITDTTIRGSGVGASGGAGVALTDGAAGILTRVTLSNNVSGNVFVAGTVAGTTTTADIADSTLTSSPGSGLLGLSLNATAALKISVRDSRAVRNGGAGLAIQSPFGAYASLAPSNNIISNNAGAGIDVAGGRAWASGNTVSDNGTGFNNSGGLFESAGNNALRNNATPTAGTITVVSTM